MAVSGRDLIAVRRAEILPKDELASSCGQLKIGKLIDVGVVYATVIGAGLNVSTLRDLTALQK
jgi:hypothetical protein